MGKAQRPGRKKKPIIPVELINPLDALQHLIALFNDRGVIIGGVAASLLGRPRLTVDLDAVILLNIKELPRLMTAAAEAGMTTRVPDAEDFARKNRVLLLRHESSGINIDISLGILPFESEMIERAQDFRLGARHIRLPTPEDLIIMKAIAHRPKDIEDIKSVAASHPALDKARIQFWLDQFGSVLELPNLWKEIEILIG